MLSADDADRKLFDTQVSCALVARVAVAKGAVSHAQLGLAERVLRDLALMDERGIEPTEAGEAKALRRLEAQMDLMMSLMAALVADRTPGVPEVAARLSGAGVAFVQAGSGSLPECATLVWQPSEAVPVLIHLPVRRIAAEGNRNWWSFHDLPAPLADRVSRAVFRLHRRQLAEAKLADA